MEEPAELDTERADARQEIALTQEGEGPCSAVLVHVDGEIAQLDIAGLVVERRAYERQGVEARRVDVMERLDNEAKHVAV